MIKTISYRGVEAAYDDEKLNSWSVTKRLMDPVQQFGAIDEILCGRSDEVAAALGDDIDEMIGLIQAIMQANGNAGKN